MAALTPQTLDWIDRAPARAHGEARSNASPDAVFRVLADHERWTEWFPSVRKVEVIGAAEGVGARRRVSIPMVTVDEEFIVWEPGARWSFTGLSSSRRWTRSLIEDCILTATADGGSDISYTMYIDPVGPVGFLMKRSLGRISSNLAKAMKNLAARASES